MNTSNNIAAMQGVGAVNSSQGLAKGQGPQDLLGFFSAIIAQLQSNGSGIFSPAENSATPAQASALKGVVEKVSSALTNAGITEENIKTMSAEELAAKVAALFQQQPGLLPPALGTVAPEELASRVADFLQQNGLAATQAAGVKTGLTRDLLAPQSAQATAEEYDLDPSILRKMESQGITLDTATGDLSAADKQKLLTFLEEQGVAADDAQQYLAALTKDLKTQLAATPNAAAAAETKATDKTAADIAATVAAAKVKSDAPVAGALSQGLAAQDDAAIFFSGHNSTRFRGPLSTAGDTVSSAQPGMTAKVDGYGAAGNPALINELAQNGGEFDTGGFGSDTPGQHTDTPDTLQPVSTDALRGQAFTNYMTAAKPLASPTTQMINIQIQRNMSAGINNMTLQLDPAELGRMDVELKFAKDGSLRAHMSVEKPETLALLQKDSHHLQRLLQESGLNVDDSALSFDLRQQGHNENAEGYDGRGAQNAHYPAAVDTTANDNLLLAQLAVQSYGMVSASGVNIMV